jgi:hypothetical protein
VRKPSKDFSTRYASAKAWRDAARPFIEEIYRFCRPGREFDFSRKSKSEYDTDVFISIGEELADDLAGDLVNYFTPAEAEWSSYVVLAPIPEDQVEQVMSLVEGREEQVREAITASNYYDMAPQWGFEAASHGTPALWVDKAHLTAPVHFELVPPSELLITPGYLGILDRFREKDIPASALKAMFQGWEVDLSADKIKAKVDKPGATVLVCWGFWLDWGDPGNPRWKCEITVEGATVTGEQPIDIGPIGGSCPLIVGRFNPQPGRPWGRGPGWKSLPDLRVYDKVDEIVLSGMDQAVTNTLIYPSDAGLDLSEGIEAGRAYPAGREFTRDQIFELNRNVNVDAGWFAEDRIEQRIRRSFFQDGPRQRGDTPPTAAQWVDERRRVQQRLGKPSAPLWTEMIAPMIQRIEYLLVQARQMEEAITHNGAALTIQPISPMQKAQNQDQVMISRSNLGLLAELIGPEQLQQVVDVISTGKAIVKKSGDTLTKIRDEQLQPEQPAPGPAA